jgi:hypothetical protein
MNWGYKILVIYIIFITGILFLVFKSSSQNQDLVTPDYYEQELVYQDKIDKMTRAGKLSAPVTFKQENRRIVIYFPEEMNQTEISADVLLYYIADKERDVKKSIVTNNGMMALDIPVANNGLHDLKIGWTAKGSSYYFEDKIVIQ